MTIQNNPMNPIPMWPAMSYWQSEQLTFHDAMAWPFVDKGIYPAFQFTLVNNKLPTNVKTINLEYNGSGMSLTYSLTVGGDIDVQAGTGRELMILATDDPDIYNVRFLVNLSVHDMLDNGNPNITRLKLYQGVTLTNEDGTVEIMVTVDMLVRSIFSFRLYKYDDTPAYSGSIDIETGLHPVPRKLRTYNRYAYVFFDEMTVAGTYDDGVYYMTMEDVDHVVRYSEPFMWVGSLGRKTLMTYRRSEPVVTTDNYMPFVLDGVAKSLKMYLPGLLTMPPFEFDAEVKEIDGIKYPQKLVSYRKDKMEFHCYEAFVEAIRLLWHCDIRTIDGRRVDYMEPPEVDWSRDNHLCHVTLEFESDTVVQTNGFAAAYTNSGDTEHMVYDNSFDNSFS